MNSIEFLSNKARQLRRKNEMGTIKRMEIKALVNALEDQIDGIKSVIDNSELLAVGLAASKAEYIARMFGWGSE